MIPGVAINVIMMVAVTLATAPPSKEVTDEFDLAIRFSQKATDPDADVDAARAAVGVESDGPQGSSS